MRVCARSRFKLTDYPAMAGRVLTIMIACYIMYRMPIMQANYEEDKEMLFYSSMDELVDKIKFYTHPRQDSARADIKRRAHERSVRDHTWTHRFDHLFQSLGLT